MGSPSEPTTRTGELIRRARKHRGWSQTKLGRYLAAYLDRGSQNVISMIERGEQLPDFEQAAALDAMLGTGTEIRAANQADHEAGLAPLPEELAILPPAPRELFRDSPVACAIARSIRRVVAPSPVPHPA